MILSDAVGVFPKILGGLLLLLVCMGVFVSLGELLDGLFGAALYAALALVAALTLSLLDTRVQRVATDALRAFATGVLALYLPVLLGVGVLLALGAIFFLIRKLGAVPETGNAVVPYRGNDR
jgi:chromate transport protein ChrA